VRDTNKQRKMNIIGESVILAYADDIVVFGNTKEEVTQTTKKQHVNGTLHKLR